MYEPRDVLQATANISADWSIHAAQDRDKDAEGEESNHSKAENQTEVSAEVGLLESGTWSSLGSHAGSKKDRSKKLSRHSPPPTYFPPTSENQYRRDFLSELMSSSDEEDSMATKRGWSRAWNTQNSKSLDLQPSDLISSSDGASADNDDTARSSSKAKSSSRRTKTPPSNTSPGRDFTKARAGSSPPSTQPGSSRSSAHNTQISHVTGIKVEKVPRRNKPAGGDSGVSRSPEVPSRSPQGGTFASHGSEERNATSRSKQRGPSPVFHRPEYPKSLGSEETKRSWKVEDRRPKDREPNSSIKLVEEALSAVRKLDRTGAQKSGSSPAEPGNVSPDQFSIDDEIRQILEIDADIDAMLSTGFSPVRPKKSPTGARARRTTRKAFPEDSLEHAEDIPPQYNRWHPSKATGAGVVAVRRSESPPFAEMNRIQDDGQPSVMLQGTYPQYRPARDPNVGKGLPVYRVSGKYNVPTSLRPPVEPVASQECFDTYSSWWDVKVSAAQGAKSRAQTWDEEPHLITNSLAASPAAKDFGRSKFERSRYRSRQAPNKDDRFDSYSPYVQKTGLENLPLEYRKMEAQKRQPRPALRRNYMDDLLKTGTASGNKSRATTWSSVQDYFQGGHAGDSQKSSSAVLDVHPYF